MAQVRSNANKVTINGCEKTNELKRQGQELVVEQLDHVSEAAQVGKRQFKVPKADASIRRGVVKVE